MFIARMRTFLVFAQYLPFRRACQEQQAVMAGRKCPSGRRDRAGANKPSRGGGCAIRGMPPRRLGSSQGSSNDDTGVDADYNPTSLGVRLIVYLP
jgi:hypothetical protein